MGRQHHLGLEVEGVSYELLLGNDEELLQQARREGQQHQQRAALPGTRGPALPAIAAASSGVSGSGSLPVPLLPDEHFADVRAAGPGSGLGGAGGQGRAASLALPAATLSGPLELVLSEPEQVRGPCGYSWALQTHNPYLRHVHPGAGPEGAGEWDARTGCSRCQELTDWS